MLITVVVLVQVQVLVLLLIMRYKMVEKSVPGAGMRGINKCPHCPI